jgi:hypothetical protein
MRQLNLITVLVFLNLVNFSISAHNVYKSGYIINLKGDTIKGYLLEQSSINASKKCVFKSTLEGEKIDYKPNEITGYRFIDGKYYISKQTGINKDQVKETVFMEFFIKGIACIYYYVDDKSEHFYIEKTPYGLVELSDPDLAVENANKAKSQYKGKLKVIMADCPEIVNEINNTQLNYLSLVKLSKDYHNRVCTTENCVIFERKPTPVIVNFGIILGSSYNKYKFGSELFSDYRPEIQVGVSMRIKNILFSNDKFSLNVDVLLEKDSKYTMKPYNNNRYVHTSYNGVAYIMTSFPLNYSIPELTVDLKLISLKIPLMINYNFDFHHVSIVPGIGITNKFVLSSNKQFKIENFEDQYGRTIQPYLLGFVGKIGFETTILKSSTLYFNLLYEYLSDPFAVNSLLRLTENNYSFQAGFRF